jgi:hypothetical protein
MTLSVCKRELSNVGYRADMPPGWQMVGKKQGNFQAGKHVIGSREEFRRGEGQ